MIKLHDQLPTAPLGDRVIVQPDPVVDLTESRLHIPDVAQNRSSSGFLRHAGLGARDVMYDNGWEIGDHIWFGKFAGVWEEWDHITKDGKKTCAHENVTWVRAHPPGDRMQAWTCAECDAYRLKEPIWLMNVSDILCSDDLQIRIDNGAVRIVRGKTADGKTRHIIQREETKGSA